QPQPGLLPHNAQPYYPGATGPMMPTLPSGTPPAIAPGASALPPAAPGAGPAIAPTQPTVATPVGMNTPTITPAALIPGQPGAAMPVVPASAIQPYVGPMTPMAPAMPPGMGRTYQMVMPQQPQQAPTGNG